MRHGLALLLLHFSQLGWIGLIRCPQCRSILAVPCCYPCGADILGNVAVHLVAFGILKLEMEIGTNTVRFQRVEQQSTLRLRCNDRVLGLLIKAEIVLRQNDDARAAVVPSGWRV